MPGHESRHLVKMGNERDVATEVHQGAMQLDTLSGEMPLTGAILRNRGTEVEQAVKENPDLVLLWAGGNDSLHALFAGMSTTRRSRRCTISNGTCV